MQLRSLRKHYKIPTVVTDCMTAGGKSWMGLNTLGAGDLQSWRGPVGRLHAPMPPACSAAPWNAMKRDAVVALRSVVWPCCMPACACWMGTLADELSTKCRTFDPLPHTCPLPLRKSPLRTPVLVPNPSYTIRYDTRCYFNVRSKADMSRLNLPHGDDN